MAEIILPPEENEETPQAPELNIDKPTENSKVITIEFEAKKTNKVSTKDTNQQLYTTDTDAWFEFKETSLEGANGTYSVVFRNRHDGSIFQRTGDVVNGVAYYKIPHQEIRHAGAWRGQIVYTLSNGDTTAREFDYDVKGHILDGKDVREIVVEDFETLMSQLRSMKDNAESELANLVNTANQNETSRQAFFDDLVEDIDNLQANYQELLDTGVLQTNINTKLEALEEEYAPKLTEVTAQLAQAEKEMKTERTHVYNNKESDKSAFEIHNFSDQEGRGQSSEVTHHYTDAVAKVIDNVGENTILVLSNSQNATNRPDKPADYVGTGKVLQYRRYSNDINNYEIVFEVTRDGNVVKTGKGSGSDTTFKLTNQKDVDGQYGFTFENTKAHVFPFQFRNGGAFLTFVSNVNHTMAQISSSSRMTSGLELVASAGDLFLKANNGTIKLNRDGSYFQAQLTMNGATSNRPTTDLTIGLMYFDLTLGKPIWYKGGGIWCDATGSAV